MNIVIDVGYLISGTYTYMHTFLCKKCDAGYYFINRGVYRRSCYLLAFIVSISLLRKNSKRNMCGKNSPVSVKY